MSHFKRILFAVGAFGAAMSVGCLTAPDPASGDPNVLPDPNDVVQNSVPVARAGDNLTASSGELVVLDGAGSTDADGDRLTFVWRQLESRPTIVLEDGFSTRPRFFAPMVDAATTVTFRLTVIDGLSTDVDDVRVTINP